MDIYTKYLCPEDYAFQNKVPTKKNHCGLRSMFVLASVNTVSLCANWLQGIFCYFYKNDVNTFGFNFFFLGIAFVLESMATVGFQ